jgi:hypothetical protein
MATDISNDDISTSTSTSDISTSDISDMVRTRQRKDDAANGDVEHSESSHKGRKSTVSKNGKGKGSVGTLFDNNTNSNGDGDGNGNSNGNSNSNKEAVEQLGKSINGMDLYSDHEVSVNSVQDFPVVFEQTPSLLFNNMVESNNKKGSQHKRMLPKQTTIKQQQRTPASLLEVKKKDRIASNPRKRTAERKTPTSMSPPPTQQNNISSNSGSRKGNYSLSGIGKSETQTQSELLKNDASTSSISSSINSKSSSRKRSSVNGTTSMKSPSTPSRGKVKLKVSSSPFKGRKSTGSRSSAPSSLELQSTTTAAEHVEWVHVVQSSLLHPPSPVSAPNPPAAAGSSSTTARRMNYQQEKGGGRPTPGADADAGAGAGHAAQTMQAQAIGQAIIPIPMRKEEIAVLSQSTTHSVVESAHTRDATEDDSNANANNADTPEWGDAGMEAGTKDHARQQQQKTESSASYSQPTNHESLDASLKNSKSAQIPSTRNVPDLSTTLLSECECQSPTPKIVASDQSSSMPSSLGIVAVLQAEAAAINKAKASFEKQQHIIAKIAGGAATKIDDSHYSTKNGKRDEKRSAGLKSISSLDSSKLEDNSYATEEPLPVNSASEARWHPVVVVEQDSSLKSSARRNDEKTTTQHPQHETEKRWKGRPTLGATLASGKKNALNISAHSGDSSMGESSKMEEGPVAMAPVLHKARWLPAVEEEHDATLPTADTAVISSKTQFAAHTSGHQLDSDDDDEVAESEKLVLVSDSSSAKRVADSTLKKAAMKSVTDNGNLNDTYLPTDKSVGDQGEDRKMIPSIDGSTLPGEPHIDLESESEWHRVPVGRSPVTHGKYLKGIDRPSMRTLRSPEFGNIKRPEGPLSLHGSQTEEMKENDGMHMPFQVGDFPHVENMRPSAKLKTIEGGSGVEKLGNRSIKKEMEPTQKFTEGERKETKSAKSNGSPRHPSRSAEADTYSDTDDDVTVATSFPKMITNDSLYTTPSQEEYGTTNESSPPSEAQGRTGSGPLDTRPTGFFLGTTLSTDESELASPHVNTTTESSGCCESETESSGDDKDKKGSRRNRRSSDSDVHSLQSMPANYFNSPSTVKLGGPGLPQDHDSPGGRSIQSLDRNKGLQRTSSHHRRLLRQQVNSRREVLTSMLHATTKNTHSTENELLDLKRKLASSQALVQQLEVENAQIRRQAVLDVARVQMIVQTKRHNRETELESQIKELIIERSAVVQENHGLRMMIMDSCAACQNRLPDREFEMDDSVRRTIMGRRSVRRSSAFEWLTGNLSEEAQDREEASSAASRKLNPKGRRFHDESDTYSLTSTLPDTGSIARSSLPTFGEAPLHWLSSKILKKEGQEKDDISESDPPMIEEILTYNTVSADANDDEHKSSSSVHAHGKNSANAVKTSDTGNASSVHPKLLASASVPTNSYTSDVKSVERHMAADKKADGSFVSNGSVSGEQASTSKHVFVQVPHPAKKKTFFGSLRGEKVEDEFPPLALQAEQQTKLAKEKQTAAKGRFSLFGSFMAEQVENDIPLLPGHAAGVKPILQDKPENGISKDSDNGKGGKTASGATRKKGFFGFLDEQVDDDEDLSRLVPSSAAKARARVSATNNLSCQEVQLVGLSGERLNEERVEDDSSARRENDASSVQSSSLGSSNSAEESLVRKTGESNVKRTGGKVGSPGIKSGAVLRGRGSIPAPWHPAPSLDDSIGILSFKNNNGSSDQDPLEERDSYNNLGTVDVDLIGSHPWLNDAGKRARKVATKALNDDLDTSNPEESLMEQDVDPLASLIMRETADWDRVRSSDK